MNPFEFEMHCSICNDKNRFRTTVNMARNINSRIEDVIGHKYSDLYFSDLNSYEKELFHRISFDVQHPHFMCGKCLKVNYNELKREEERLHLMIIGTIRGVREGQITENQLNLVGNLIQGHYPVCHRELRRFRNELSRA